MWRSIISGAVGITGIEAINVASIEPDNLKLILQIILALISLFAAIWKGKKKKKDKKNES